MTTAPYVTAARAPGASPASSRLLLWLPVPVAVGVAFCLIRGDTAISQGVADLDPLYGLSLLFIGAVCAVIALVSLVLAVVFSFTSPAARAGGALGSAIWMAATGAALTALVAWGQATDAELATSSTAGDQYVWQVAAFVVALLPLAALLVARTLSRAR